MTALTLPSVLTIAEAAHDLSVTEAKIWKFHRDGRLAIMYMAGTPLGDRRGAKDGRIDRGEWDRFKQSLMVTLRPEPPAAPAPPRRGRPSDENGGATPGSFAERFAAKMRDRPKD